MTKPRHPVDGRQYRSLSVPLTVVGDGESRLLDSDYYVEGYATTFDDPYTLFGDYKEVIDRHALDDADMSDVVMHRINHEGTVIARLNRTNTLALEVDEHGLKIGADLSKSAAAREAYEEIANGLVTKMSWMFTVPPDGDEFDEETKTFRVMRVGKVYDVSPVSIPADPNTEISARALYDGEIKRAVQELGERKRRVAATMTAIQIATFINER